jgi:hypothetical protein
VKPAVLPPETKQPGTRRVPRNVGAMLLHEVGDHLTDPLRFPCPEGTRRHPPPCAGPFKRHREKTSAAMRGSPSLLHRTCLPRQPARKPKWPATIGAIEETTKFAGQARPTPAAGEAMRLSPVGVTQAVGLLGRGVRLGRGCRRPEPCERPSRGRPGPSSSTPSSSSTTGPSGPAPSCGLQGRPARAVCVVGPGVGEHAIDLLAARRMNPEGCAGPEWTSFDQRLTSAGG